MMNRPVDRIRGIERVRARGVAALLIGFALVIVMATQPASAQIVPPGSTVEGKTIGDWGFEWWQWLFGITDDDPWSDDYGAIQNAGQKAPVFFTCAGTEDAALFPITRSFLVPQGTYILAGLSTTGVYYEPGVDAPDICQVGVPAFIDLTTSLSFSLDGVPISQVDLSNDHREVSSFPLTAHIPDGSLYFPPGDYPGSCAEGYFVMIEPLPPGPHVIECGFTHPNDGVPLMLDHTNEIYVSPLVGAQALAYAPGVKHVEVSPNGSHAYAAVSLGVNSYDRDEVTGDLSVFQTYPHPLNIESAWVAVSADGANVYSVNSGFGVSGFGSSVAVFARDAVTGVLTFVESLGDGVGGVDGLNGANRVLVSSDLANVYVTGERGCDRGV